MIETLFSHRQPHLHTAHALWYSLLQSGDTAIDATCGNGHDTLILAQILLAPTKGQLLALDIQPEAIAHTKERLSQQLPKEIFTRIQFYQQSHTTFPIMEQESVKLIVYNLGYLPGGDKSFTTVANTTIESLCQATSLLAKGGLITVTCYPGHPAGSLEEQALLAWVTSLPREKWSIHHQRWLHRPHSPTLLSLFHT